jgi:hypothetical protein
MPIGMTLYQLVYGKLAIYQSNLSSNRIGRSRGGICDSSSTCKLGTLFVSVKYVLVSVKLVCVYVKLLKT